MMTNSNGQVEYSAPASGCSLEPVPSDMVTTLDVTGICINHHHITQLYHEHDQDDSHHHDDHHHLIILITTKAIRFIATILPQKKLFNK